MENLGETKETHAVVEVAANRSLYPKREFNDDACSARTYRMRSNAMILQPAVFRWQVLHSVHQASF